MFAFPSCTEGMLDAFLEAMAAGLPVVASDVLANREVITHGRAGLLIPVSKPKSFAEMVRWVVMWYDDPRHAGERVRK